MSDETPPPLDGVTVPDPEFRARGYVFELGAFSWHDGRGNVTFPSCESIARTLNDVIADRDLIIEQRDRAQATITDYSDYRLQQMWEEAGRIADRAGHCSVYDDLVRELGGIPREREYYVTVPVNGYVYVTVTASSEDDAEEIARGMADVDDAENLELDWSNAYTEQN